MTGTAGTAEQFDIALVKHFATILQLDDVIAKDAAPGAPAFLAAPTALGDQPTHQALPKPASDKTDPRASAAVDRALLDQAQPRRQIEQQGHL